jgi:hypothetical protein
MEVSQMRSQLIQKDRTHWEGLVRAIIAEIGPDELAEVIEYVVAEMRAEAMLLRMFAVANRARPPASAAASPP